MDGLISGSRAILRLLPQHRGAVVLLTNGSTGRVLYRSLFPILLEAWFGVGMPALRLAPHRARPATWDASRACTPGQIGVGKSRPATPTSSWKAMVAPSRRNPWTTIPSWSTPRTLMSQR
jgi:hypothetical protein